MSTKYSTFCSQSKVKSNLEHNGEDALYRTYVMVYSLAVKLKPPAPPQVLGVGGKICATNTQKKRKRSHCTLITSHKSHFIDIQS